MSELVFVTQNKHKLEEVTAMLPDDFSLISLADINFYDDIIETGSTLEENSRIKAQTIHNKFHVDCFADDTGLEVEALNGAPGVLSARYAGIEHDFAANLTKLQADMVGLQNRKARFRTVITLIIKNKEYQFEGIVNGTIIDDRRGVDGFGYDPVFLPEGYDKTFAEMALDKKNKISHRALAFKKLNEYLSTL